MPNTFKKKKIMSICLSVSEGGLEFCVIRFAKKLQNEGHDSIIICLKNSNIESKARSADLNFFSISEKNFFLRLYMITKLIKHFDPDILISHRSLSAKISIIYKLFFKKIKLIYFIHTLVNYSKNDFFHKFIYSKINKFVVFTDVQKINALKYMPIQEEQIKVIPHYVNTVLFSPLAQTQFLEESVHLPQVLTIGCVGRFDLKKGQLELIEAARILKKKNIPFNLIFIGKDTQFEEGVKSQCEKLAHKYNLTTEIKFYEHQNAISDFYKTFDIFVMPSYEETFGLVLIEAMASGCLCVSTNAGGPTEILDQGRAGILVEPQSAGELAQALEKIINNPKSFNHIRQASIHRARTFYAEEKNNFSEALF
jgi:glycosyltransferase involved in cell wall biosynthesis